MCAPAALPPPSCSRAGPSGRAPGCGGGSVGTGEALGGPQRCEARERKRGAAPPQVVGPEGGEPGPGPLLAAGQGRCCPGASQGRDSGAGPGSGGLPERPRGSRGPRAASKGPPREPARSF